MFSSLGPIRIDCDAPPYSVVKVCEEFGFESPLDVRWCRMSHFIDRCSKVDSAPDLALLMYLILMSRPKHQTCTCGAPLPPLEWYCFTFLSGKVANYHMGQCRKCRTIFWEED